MHWEISAESLRGPEIDMDPPPQILYFHHWYYSNRTDVAYYHTLVDVLFFQMARNCTTERSEAQLTSTIHREISTGSLRGPEIDRDLLLLFCALTTGYGPM